MGANVIQPMELLSMWKQDGNLEVIDVRTPAEYRDCHLEFARNIPLDRLDPRLLCNTAKERKIVFVCQSGGRGQQACDKLLKAGVANVFNVEGGTLACRKAGLPMVEGKRTISLERQVRIAAGFFVLLGSLLGWFIHPAFLGLSSFVGAGLIFAGITDTCGMGMLLARMPWNRDGGSSQACQI